jgi:hypothetical protein
LLENLEVGDCVGELSVETCEVQVDDAALRSRLVALLREPLTRRLAAPLTLGTAQVAVSPGEEGYTEALVERLRKRDFRLHAS